MERNDLAFFARKVIWKVRYRLGKGPQLSRRKRAIAEILEKLVIPRTVQSGPFSGMKYLDSATGSALIPKLLGSYESCLHPWIEELGRANFARIYDVGCAEGYYACGLKIISPNSEVTAYDTNQHARDLCQKLSELNNVSVNLAAEFIPEQANLSGALVFMDVEGFEQTLLSRDRVKLYEETTIIVEAHNYIFGYGDLTKEITTNFQESHFVEILHHAESGLVPQSVQRNLKLTNLESQQLADELRAGKNDWLRLTPRRRLEPAQRVR